MAQVIPNSGHDDMIVSLLLYPKKLAFHCSATWHIIRALKTLKFLYWVVAAAHLKILADLRSIARRSA